MEKIIIIGGGASGLITSIFAKNKDNEVIILERNNTCGKKILLTGNGKCNYWNDDQDISHYHSSSPIILNKILDRVKKEDIFDFFDKIGIVPKIKNGYYYPYSNQANTIKEALIKEALIRGVKIICDTFVSDIIKNNDGFVVKTTNSDFFCNKVVVSTGSRAYPKTGSDGSGYLLLEKLGHSIVPVVPSLVQLVSANKYCSEWDGIREDVIIKLYEDNVFIKEEKGEIQLTNYGISGICTMQLSGIVNRGLLLNKKEKVVINFLPFLEIDFITWMNERNEKVLNRTISELLDGVINYKLTNLFLKVVGIDKDCKWNEISENEKNKLAKIVTSFELDIVSSNSYDKAQVCSGGVDLKEINPLSLESLVVKDLYITGELLDVDGDCGGYNLSFAWMSGMIAGRDISD